MGWGRKRSRSIAQRWRISQQAPTISNVLATMVALPPHPTSPPRCGERSQGLAAWRERGLSFVSLLISRARAATRGSLCCACGSAPTASIRSSAPRRFIGVVDTVKCCSSPRAPSHKGPCDLRASQVSDRGRDVDLDKIAADFRHQPPHFGAGRGVGRDRRADRDAAVPCDLAATKTMRITLVSRSSRENPSPFDRSCAQVAVDSVTGRPEPLEQAADHAFARVDS